MSRSGYGRGRGWLKINKNNSTEPTKPGIYSHSTSYNGEGVNYGELIDILSVLDPSDDGIKLNQKIKHVADVWSRVCENEEQTIQSVKFIYEEGLRNLILSEKLIMFVTSNQFNSSAKSVHNVSLRMEYIKVLQENFQKKDSLKLGDPNLFYNSIRSFVLFSKRCTSLNVIVSATLLEYMEMLIDTAKLDDLKVAAYVVYSQSELFMKNPDSHKILNKIRKLLICDIISIYDRLWLLLILDLVASCGKDLHSETVYFYTKELGKQELENAGIDFKCTTSLHIEIPPPTKSLGVENAENVSVLTKSNNLSQSQADSCFNSSDGFTSDSRSDSTYSTGSNSDLIQKPMEKLGRPILGVGSRLNKPSNHKDEDIDRFKHSQNNWGAPKMPPPSWEHDDRFDNDYS